jgi:tetratricopeptide (TPR) repeat protein
MDTAATRSVEEIEAALTENSEDLQVELARALFDRYVFEAGPDEDLERVAQIAQQTPSSLLRYERGYLALLDGDDAVAIDHFRGRAVEVSNSNGDPFTSDELWDWIEPLFEIAPDEVFEGLADGFSAGWPDSPMVATLRALAKENDATALELLQAALAKDPKFWIANYEAGNRYLSLKDYGTAREYLQRAIESETAADLAEIWFSLAWCAGKLKLLEEEANEYRSCLELDPDFPFARNNLGWSLFKASKYDDAIPIFRAAIERGNDGKLPLRNLARVLIHTRRFDEAVEVLKSDTRGGKITAHSRRELEKIERLRNTNRIVDASSDSIEGETGIARPSRRES